MARANLKKVNTSQLLLPQHQSTYPRGPESASIEIPPIGPKIFFVNVALNVNIVKQDLLNKKTVFENLWSEVWTGISIDADSGPLGYVLWCCGSRSWEVLTFFQIGSGQTWKIRIKAFIYSKKTTKEFAWFCHQGLKLVKSKSLRQFIKLKSL